MISLQSFNCEFTPELLNKILTNGVTTVTCGFVIDDLNRLNQSCDLGIETLRLVAVNDWDFEGLRKHAGADEFNCKVDEDKRLSVMVLNLNDVESCSDEKTASYNQKLDAKVRDCLAVYGWRDVSNWIDYENRMVFVLNKGPLALRTCDTITKDCNTTTADA